MPPNRPDPTYSRQCCTGTHAPSLPPPLLYPSLSLAWVPTHVGHLHTPGRAHTLQMPLPSPFGSDSHPSAPLLPIRLAFSLSSISHSSSGSFAYSPAPKFSFLFLKLGIVQYKRRRRNAIVAQSLPTTKKSSCKGERGGEGNSARQSSCRLPPPFCSIEFLRLVFPFIFDAFGDQASGEASSPS